MSAEDLSAEDLVTIELPMTRLGQRYRESSVDDFLDEVIRALRAGTANGALLERAKLEPARSWRAGYAAGPVDALLTRLAHQLERPASSVDG